LNLNKYLENPGSLVILPHVSLVFPALFGFAIGARETEEIQVHVAEKDSPANGGELGDVTEVHRGFLLGKGPNAEDCKHDSLIVLVVSGVPNLYDVVRLVS
jgi:hypothetical protein